MKELVERIKENKKALVAIIIVFALVLAGIGFLVFRNISSSSDKKAMEALMGQYEAVYSEEDFNYYLENGLIRYPIGTDNELMGVKKEEEPTEVVEIEKEKALEVGMDYPLEKFEKALEGINAISVEEGNTTMQLVATPKKRMMRVTDDERIFELYTILDEEKQSMYLGVKNGDDEIMRYHAYINPVNEENDDFFATEEVDDFFEEETAENEAPTTETGIDVERMIKEYLFNNSDYYKRTYKGTKDREGVVYELVEVKPTEKLSHTYYVNTETQKVDFVRTIREVEEEKTTTIISCYEDKKVSLPEDYKYAEEISLEELMALINPKLFY